MVPHLTTALSGPLLELERRFLDSSTEIEHWLRGQWQEHTPPFYSSCDLRNSGFKLAPVDTNLFPGGFNNLNQAFLPLCVQAAMSAIEKICPDARNLLLIPENHTRNLFYLQNVAQIAAILRQTGLNVRLGSLLPEITQPTPIDLPNGQQLLLEPLVRGPHRLGLDGFDPCAVLLNNDLSAGIPPILQNLQEQFVLPPLHAGWAVRRKSNHFAAYDQVANDFAREIGIDPWRINPTFSVCRSINFHERQGEECLAANVAAVLDIVKEKYKEYEIDETPYVVVKADAGTYGMGIMTVRDAEEVIALNRKQRNKMSVGKEGLEVSEVLIQEGVHSFETVNEAVAEPVIYMIDRYVVGGFYRVHTGRGKDENLNAPGMHFEPLAFDTGCNLPDYRCGNPDSPPNRFYAYGVVGRLACLAAAIELERTAPEGD
ncbi:MAG: glutamate--cysteine ligase [Betaproteobacteria bacterium HGW-Betaproteobacteria-7]|jgi:glutamate--cysteine ligase|nr:MAG: glutamate--cysteine ligase [Betaproteobacteria bacterium HGW-Betaproteobacteria-7]